ncbi:hypothetical protein OESDEN_08951 [Oesophagostomum dentatum]|uniref:Uncharacterized protein n=1 Tax=Oesophagostomum dentatum TaxID=61180 RepID=A0A0B1T501_OESDE|nr:hypothetical protein OESDEN_08951 [Oesophagostomum dentatum]
MRKNAKRKHSLRLAPFAGDKPTDKCKLVIDPETLNNYVANDAAEYKARACCRIRNMSDDKDIGWMYQGAKALVNREDYLLGKKIDKNFEKYSDAVNEQKPEALDALLHTRTVVKPQPTAVKTSALESYVVATEDPLVAVKVKEETRRREVLENPLMKLKKSIENREIVHRFLGRRRLHAIRGTKTPQSLIPTPRMNLAMLRNVIANGVIRVKNVLVLPSCQSKERTVDVEAPHANRPLKGGEGASHLLNVVDGEIRLLRMRIVEETVEKNLVTRMKKENRATFVGVGLPLGSVMFLEEVETEVVTDDGQHRRSAEEAKKLQGKGGGTHALGRVQGGHRPDGITDVMIHNLHLEGTRRGLPHLRETIHLETRKD